MEPQSLKDLLFCELCSIQFEEISAYDMHMTIIHGGTKLVKIKPQMRRNSEIHRKSQ